MKATRDPDSTIGSSSLFGTRDSTVKPRGGTKWLALGFVKRSEVFNRYRKPAFLGLTVEWPQNKLRNARRSSRTKQAEDGRISRYKWRRNCAKNVRYSPCQTWWKTHNADSRKCSMAAPSRRCDPTTLHESPYSRSTFHTRAASCARAAFSLCILKSLSNLFGAHPAHAYIPTRIPD